VARDGVLVWPERRKGKKKGKKPELKLSCHLSSRRKKKRRPRAFLPGHLGELTPDPSHSRGEKERSEPAEAFLNFPPVWWGETGCCR